jgi:uncharacterized protein YndB with AHSA1/START domain
MTAPVPSLTLVRLIKAPPALVYAAWTRPELLVRWWGPHHTRATSAEADVRVGGRFRTVLVEEGGARHEVSGTYTEVEPGRRLVFTWAWAAQAPARQSRVTVSFRAVAEGTELTLVHDRFADADTASRHRRGWTESFARLAAQWTAAAAE